MPGLILSGCLYELRTLARPMEGFGGSLSDGDDEEAWATPSVCGNHNRIGASATSGDGLATQVNAWPTPSASNPNDGESWESWESRRVRVQAEGINGNGMGMPLGIAVKPQAWPSPRASDGEHLGANPTTTTTTRRLAADQANLPEAVLENGRVFNSTPGLMTLEAAPPFAEKNWPTPTSAAAIQGENEPDGKRGQTLVSAARSQHWPTPCVGRNSESPTGGPSGGLNGGAGARASLRDGLGEKAANAIIGGSLNPAWVECLMGWPLGWTDAMNPCPGIWPGWPAGMGPHQHAYEPPRISPKGSVANRVARIKACGNGVVPKQAEEGYGTLLRAALGIFQEKAG